VVSQKNYGKGAPLRLLPILHLVVNTLNRILKELPKAYLWIGPCLVVLFLITIIPTVFLAITSLNYWELGYPWAERIWVGIRNYTSAFTNRQFLHSIRVTIVYTLSTVSIEFILGFAIAWFLSRPSLAMRSFLIACLIIPMTVTPSIAGLIWRLYFNPSYGIVNYVLGKIAHITPNWYSYNMALPSVILVDIWQWTPFVALVLLAGLSAIPRSPIEAALVDGADSWQMIRYVFLPLLRPIILIVLILRTMDALKMFDVVFSLTGGGPADATELLSMHVYRTGFYQSGMVGLASAMAVVLLIVIMLFSRVFIRLLGEQETGEGVM
jgi:multiple sugar transport system permease protein